jgi:hypothetical protein
MTKGLSLLLPVDIVSCELRSKVSAIYFDNLVTLSTFITGFGRPSFPSPMSLFDRNNKKASFPFNTFDVSWV